MGIRYLNHTADIGIRITARTLKEIFSLAGKALINIIKRERPKGKKIEFSVNIKGLDLPDVLIRWLNEIIYNFSVKKLIAQEFIILSLGDKEIKAKIRGVKINPGESGFKEVKAATYHGTKIEKQKNGYLAEVIFDV